MMRLKHRSGLGSKMCAVWFLVAGMAYAQSAVSADANAAQAGVTGTSGQDVRVAADDVGVDVGRHEPAGARADVEENAQIPDSNASGDATPRPALPADAPRADCAGCGDCTCDTCGDGRISECEFAGYSCAWRSGCIDDLSSVSRTAFLWQLGGSYCWNQSSAQWMPEPASRSAPGFCTTSAEQGGNAIDVVASEGTNTASMRLLRLRSFGKPRGLGATIAIAAAAGTMAVGLEVVVPDGWTVDTISDGGVWDGLNRKVKWGPLFTDLSRRVHFTAWQDSGKWSEDGFLGTASFDGFDVPVVVLSARGR